MKIEIHKLYLLKKFLKKIFLVSCIFFALVLIINLIEEINFLKDMGGTNYKKRQLLDELVEHFVETEEYEKCAELVKLKEW